MAEFGKRNAAVSVSTYSKPRAAPADLATAIEVVKTGKLPYWTKFGPIRFLLVALIAVGGFWLVILPRAGDIIRDHRLAGTWQPAYDMKAVDGKCTVFQLVITNCNAKIISLAEPNRAPLEVGFVMAFSGGGGESMVPVRSAVDPSAVTIAYAAETKLMNRTLTFIGLAFTFAMMFFASLGALLRGRYKGGAAHRALLAGFAELKARVESAKADPRAAA